MQKIFGFLNSEIRGLHQAAFLLASASVGAKILAILRDRLLASNFGAGKALDVYYASFRIPDFLYTLSLFLVSATTIIPLFLEKKSASKEDARSFISNVFTVFSILIILLLAVAFLTMPFLIKAFVPGFNAEDSALLVKFSRILLLSPLLLGLSNLFASVVQSFRIFLTYALSGVLYNLGIILGLVVLYPVIGFSGLIWGVVFGAFLHFLIQVPVLKKLDYLPFFSLKLKLKEVGEVIKLSFSRTTGLVLNQVVLSVITALASFLAVGSIAVFNLAYNLQAIPLGIVALSYSVAAFPSMAGSFLRKDRKKFLAIIISSFRHIIFWLLPVSVLFIVLRAHIVRIILGAGVFSWSDTRLTAAALALFAISLFAQGFLLLFTRAFYAAGQTKIPIIVNAISSAVTIFLSAGFLLLLKNDAFYEFFTKLLRVEELGGVSVLALPLAYSLGNTINFFLFFILFERKFGSIEKHVKKVIFQMSVASSIIGLVTYISLNVFDGLFNTTTFIGIAGHGLLATFCGLLFGFLFLMAVKNQELKELIDSLKNKLFRRVPIEVESGTMEG